MATLQTLCDKVAEQRRRRADWEFKMAMAHHAIDPAGEHTRHYAARGFALLRAARAAERGELEA